MTLDDNELNVRSKQSDIVHVGKLRAEPTVSKGLFGTSLTFQTDDGSDFLLKAVRNGEALSFAEAVRTKWISYNTERFQAEKATIDALMKTITELADPARYPHRTSHLKETVV